MKTFINLVKAEFTMLIGEIKQYYPNYIFYNLGILILIYGLFQNYYHNSNSSIILSLLLCSVLWQICSNALSYLYDIIQDEAMLGTLEQIFTTKTSFVQIILSKIIISLSFVIVKGIILFIICSLICGKFQLLFEISFIDYIFIILICVICGFTFYLIGAVFGGLTLYFKRVSSIVNIFDYLLLFFTGGITSLANYNIYYQIILKLLPITNANILIRDLCEKNINLDHILIFIISCICWIIFSYFIFKKLINYAKKLGKLGQY